MKTDHFDFQNFIRQLEDTPEKKQIAIDYKSLVGDEIYASDIYNQPWYKHYVVHIEEVGQYKVPAFSQTDFDWILLQKLACASLSCNCNFIYDRIKDEHEMLISVENANTIITKSIADLFDYQIDRLFSIYTEELMNLLVTKKQNPNEEKIIDANQKNKLQHSRNLKTRMTLERLGLL